MFEVGDKVVIGDYCIGVASEYWGKEAIVTGFSQIFDLVILDVNGYCVITKAINLKLQNKGHPQTAIFK